MLIIQPVPCLNLGSPCHASCPDLHPGSALNNFLSSPDLSGHGAEAIGQGRIQGEGLPYALSSIAGAGGTRNMRREIQCWSN